MYYLESLSSSLISLILATDAYIFSWDKKFNNILQEMKEKLSQFSQDDNYLLLQEKISQILRKITDFRADSKYLEDNFLDLKKFHETTF